MTTTEQLHKAMIHMCLAIDKLAESMQSPRQEVSEAAARHARELVNDAHRQMVYEEEIDENGAVVYKAAGDK